jgi:hypothetical protein
VSLAAEGRQQLGGVVGWVLDVIDALDAIGLGLLVAPERLPADPERRGAAAGRLRLFSLLTVVGGSVSAIAVFFVRRLRRRREGSQTRRATSG